MFRSVTTLAVSCLAGVLLQAGDHKPANGSILDIPKSPWLVDSISFARTARLGPLYGPQSASPRVQDSRFGPSSGPTPGGYIVQHDADVARPEPGPHKGGGQTVGHSFFSEVPGLSLVFRKRALKPGSGIGYHEQREDEIYYVLSGRGEMTLDGKTVEVGPGTAILTRTGSSHGLKVLGNEDLVIIINYLQ